MITVVVCSWLFQHPAGMVSSCWRNRCKKKNESTTVNSFNAQTKTTKLLRHYFCKLTKSKFWQSCLWVGFEHLWMQSCINVPLFYSNFCFKKKEVTKYAEWIQCKANSISMALNGYPTENFHTIQLHMCNLQHCTPIQLLFPADLTVVGYALCIICIFICPRHVHLC